MENVIRVQIVHHKGRQPRGLEFKLKQQPTPEVQITDDAAAATLISGACRPCAWRRGPTGVSSSWTATA